MAKKRKRTKKERERTERLLRVIDSTPLSEMLRALDEKYVEMMHPAPNPETLRALDAKMKACVRRIHAQGDIVETILRETKE